MPNESNPHPTVQVAIAAVVENVSSLTRSDTHTDDAPPISSPNASPWRILITLRSDKQVLAGHWELPGGKIEPDESPHDAVVRELREEVGIDVEPIAELAPVDHDYPHASIRLLPYVCRHISGKPTALEVEDVRWVASNELADYRFPEASLPVIAELMDWIEQQDDAIPTPRGTMTGDPP